MAVINQQTSVRSTLDPATCCCDMMPKLRLQPVQIKGEWMLRPLGGGLPPEPFRFCPYCGEEISLKVEEK